MGSSDQRYATVIPFAMPFLKLLEVPACWCSYGYTTCLALPLLVLVGMIMNYLAVKLSVIAFVISLLVSLRYAVKLGRGLGGSVNANFG